ncbi:hypothetical protein [Phocaeicola dorei]|nr:hypothetical protein [Phocaeicola dorei]
MKLANLQNCSTSTPTHVRVHYNVENEGGYKEGMTSNGGGGQTDDAGES